jgi:hypothetical protein
LRNIDGVACAVPGRLACCLNFLFGRNRGVMFCVQ